jgi:hypothetical protein
MEEQEDTNSVSLLLTADDEQEETEDDNTTVAEASTGELDDTEMVSQENVSDNNSMIKEALDRAVRAALDDLLQQHLGTSSDDEKDIVPSDESMYIEIVGLESCTNGRSCHIHEVCGEHVEEGDLLRLVPTVVTIDGKTQEAIKLVRLMDGADGCTVAFIPRILMDLPQVQRNIKSFAQVRELYRNSTNKYKKHKSYRNMGCASCIFLQDIPISE